MAGRHRKPAAPRRPGRHRAPRQRQRWIAPAVVTVAVLGAGSVAAYAALTDGSSGPSPQVRPAASSSASSATPRPTAAPASPSPSTSPTGRPATDTRHHHAPPDALRLAVTGHMSWVQVQRVGGRVYQSGIVRHGDRLRYHHGPLDVVIGDAGAVRLIVHGRVHAPAGRDGQVLHFRVR